MNGRPPLCQTIIFDVNSLFKENHSIALRYLDKVKLLKYTARGKNPFDLRAELEKTLEKISGPGVSRSILIESWLNGSVSGNSACKIVLDYLDNILLDNPHSTTTHLLKDIARLTFSPEILSKVLEVNRKALHVAQKLKASGNYQLYLAGNLDKNTFGFLLRKHPTIFDLFEKSILSCDLGFVKPEKDYLHALASILQLIPFKSCYLDDNLEDIQVLQSFGFNALDIYSFNKQINH